MSDIVERLRDLERVEHELAQASAKMVEQAARIERLEAALREIAAYKADENEMDWADTVLEMNAIARAALEDRT